MCHKVALQEQQERAGALEQKEKDLKQEVLHTSHTAEMQMFD